MRVKPSLFSKEIEFIIGLWSIDKFSSTGTIFIVFFHYFRVFRVEPLFIFVILDEIWEKRIHRVPVVLMLRDISQVFFKIISYYQYHR